MSKAPRPATWKTRSTHLGRAVLVVGAAQVLVALLLLGQRGAARRALGGHHPLARRPSGRSASTGPTISGITSPALRRITVSPGRTSLRLHLVGVVQRGVLHRRAGDLDRLHHAERRDPAGAADVDPMSSSLVLTSSGGYLKAIAQRGARLVEPSRALERDVVDLDHHAVDLVLTIVVAVLAVRARCSSSTSARRRQHPDLRRRSAAPRRRSAS